MAAAFKNRRLQQPDRNASRARQKRGSRPHAFVGLAFSIAIALVVPNTQAISHGVDLEIAANTGIATVPAAEPNVVAPHRQPANTATPRPMTSNDRQAIFMVLMLRDPNASSQILGLTH